MGFVNILSFFLSFCSVIENIQCLFLGTSLVMLFGRCETDDAIIRYRGVIFLVSVLFSYFKLLCRNSLCTESVFYRWSEVTSQNAGEVMVRWHRVRGPWTPGGRLVRESSHPVMKRLLLFSCRQSIHQLGLPNLASNEQHNPRVCAVHAQQILAALFTSHMSCSRCFAFANNKATNRRHAFIKTCVRNSPRPFLWQPSLVAGTAWLHIPEERKLMYDHGAAEQNTF